MPDPAALRVPYPSDARGDSLALALEGLLAWYGRHVSYDELIAATGIGAMLPATDRDDCPARWCDYGRDAFLVEAAEQYGLSLRELHPPDAVPFPAAGSAGVPPAEFEAHWCDSYVPLIETALAHHQPVLAWMGWPSPYESQWGVITSLDRRTRRCAGVVAGVSQPVALDRAAVQAYVAQEFFSGGITSKAWWRAAAARWVRTLRNDLPSKFDVRTGAAALDRLQIRLDEKSYCATHKSASWHCLAQLADAASARRRASAGGFIAAGRTAVANAAAASAGAIAALNPSQQIREAWASAAARRELIGIIERIRAADVQLIDALERAV